MASPRALDWLDRAVWTLIYAGLLALVLGLATGDAHTIAGWSLVAIGGALAAAGAVLLVVRARLTPGPGAGAQSSDSTSRGSR